MMQTMQRVVLCRTKARLQPQVEHSLWQPTLELLQEQTTHLLDGIQLPAEAEHHMQLAQQHLCQVEMQLCMHNGVQQLLMTLMEERELRVQPQQLLRVLQTRPWPMVELWLSQVQRLVGGTPLRTEPVHVMQAA